MLINLYRFSKQIRNIFKNLNFSLLSIFSTIALVLLLGELIENFKHRDADIFSSMKITVLK